MTSQITQEFLSAWEATLSKGVPLTLASNTDILRGLSRVPVCVGGYSNLYTVGKERKEAGWQSWDEVNREKPGKHSVEEGLTCMCREV